MTRQGPGKIDWAHWSWSPVTGCSHRCPYCYAAALAHRFPAIHGGGPFTTPRFHPERMTDKDLRQPKDGQRVFVCSMADIFSPGVKPEWVVAVLRAVKTRPQVHFLFLTKRPNDYALFDWPGNAWLGVTLDTYTTQLQRAMALNFIQSYNRKWINAAPALDMPLDELWHYLKPDWLVAEPLHGSTNEDLVRGEANVHAWHRWADQHQVPMWIKGMKHWGVRCPIPKELPTLHRGKCSV